MPAEELIPVRLGDMQPGGLAVAMFAIVERGVRLRPGAATALNAVIELHADGHEPVTIRFESAYGVTVLDGSATSPDVRVSGPLGEIVGLLTTPLLGGIPNPLRPAGRAALTSLRGARVRVRGRVGVARRFFALISIDPRAVAPAQREVSRPG